MVSWICKTRICKTRICRTWICRTWICKTGLGLTLLAVSAAPSRAAAVTPQIHAPAQFRIDFTRPGGIPGAPRDIAAARDFANSDLPGQGTTTVRHKRRPRAH
jgi:hypothetical protein